MWAGRGVRVCWGIAVVAAVVAAGACENTRNPGGIQRDVTAPNIVLATNSDTQDIAGGLTFTVTASDNLSLKTIRLTYSGGYIAGPIDTTFITQTQSVSITEHITFPSNSGAGGNIMIVGRAIDGNGNFAEDTLFIFLSNVQALKVFLIAPSAGAVASSGKGLPIQVVAVQNSGIRKIGFVTSPAGAVTNPTTPPNDSLSFSQPYADSVSYTDTIVVVATTGFFVVQGFAEDSAGRRGTTGTVTVSILSAANDQTPPSVTDSLGLRVEVSDSVLVHATDPSAISWIGFRVDTGGVLVRFDTVDVSAGNLTDVRRMFSLGLAGLPTPSTIVVRGYACDAATARNCAYSTVSGIVNGTPSADTATVVAGVTKPLPLGGQIGDAIYNKNGNFGTGELYLTNTTLSRLEVFQVANTSFVAGGIPTAGPEPVGIALWPVDTLGNYDDTVVVANSGGTELSIVDVRAGVRRLAWRQDLPNFIIQRYKVSVGTGGATRQVTNFDVSDRPQYVGTVCRPNSGGAAACAPDSIFAIYSTTPTISSSSPFNGHATLRMEKLINTTDTAQLFGHLFWEIGNVDASGTSDTLRLVLRRGAPYNQTKVVLSACAGVTINFNTFGLGDQTFVRNSGNFTHALIGEGGNASTAFARVMAYRATGQLLQGAATFQSCNTPATQTLITDAGDNDVDFGMSPAVDVSDFISNTGVHILSIATNFNGGTNLVRADSIYYLDEGLRLKGTSCPLAADGVTCVQGAPGMDMNYNHAFQAGNPGTPTFGGSGNPNDRVVFAARPDGNIDVFDTFFYGFIRSIPVRDAVIGPLRVGKDNGGNQLLFGITARGLVMVQLPTITNPNPVAPQLKAGGSQ